MTQHIHWASHGISLQEKQATLTLFHGDVEIGHTWAVHLEVDISLTLQITKFMGKSCQFLKPSSPRKKKD